MVLGWTRITDGMGRGRGQDRRQQCTSMFFARCSAAAVEPLRSIAPEEVATPDPASDPGDCRVGGAPSPARGWLSGMAGTCQRRIQALKQWIEVQVGGGWQQPTCDCCVAVVSQSSL
jgi:hypothetical protein